MNETIKTERRDRVFILRINRPDHKNALTHDMYSRLADGLSDAHNDSDIRAILITGDTDCFTAGNDLSDFEEGLPGDFRGTPVGSFLFALAEASKPVVAAVNGPAVGIGTTMLLHCDLVWAGSNARFRMPFVNLGVCAEGGSSLLLPQWLGRVRACELLLLGKAFDAEKAEQLGLINGICDPQQTENQALETCAELAALPPASVRATKQLIVDCQAQSLTDAMTREGHLFAQRLESDEAKEAFSAFREKRQPDFSRFE